MFFLIFLDYPSYFTFVYLENGLMLNIYDMPMKRVPTQNKTIHFTVKQTQYYNVYC